MGTTNRFRVWWSRSALRWVTIEDSCTGLRTTGRDQSSLDAAMARAVSEMRRRLAAL